MKEAVATEYGAVKAHHGKRSMYRLGCRCDDCRAANTKYERNRAQVKAAGAPPNAIVSAETARAHLLALSSEGVGRVRISELSGVAESRVHGIRKGTIERIHENTEAALLAVHKEVPTDWTLVASTAARAMVAELREEGFTSAELARRLGYNEGHRFRITTKLITKQTEDRITAFYKMIMEEA